MTTEQATITLADYRAGLHAEFPMSCWDCAWRQLVERGDALLVQCTLPGRVVEVVEVGCGAWERKVT